ncbi:MAG TPA: type I phosphomannose isomerase catalytic subunit [Ktedonobacteraceae bacterium]|nr:type I phosphomannose isomerase catalytic subunit [Ktedonobacteraceae bacterium]
MVRLHPIRLEASLHETIWGGQRLGSDGWKQLPSPEIKIGEAWETEISTVAQNGPYQGKTLGELVDELDVALLGEQSIAVFGKRFPLLAKFIDANAQLSVQVHPDDNFAAQFEGGKLGKTEFWYILSAEPGATIVHGFKQPTTSTDVQRAITQATLQELLHEEEVAAGDVIFVPAGTVHAIGSGIMLYELQEYSDITYRMYDYGRLTAAGTPRELHVQQSLDVSHYGVSHNVKARPVQLPGGENFTERCLVACRYFVSRELILSQNTDSTGYMKGQTTRSCIILSSLGAELQVRYGDNFAYAEKLTPGQTMILPAALGTYCLEGRGRLVFSYVPTPGDEAWRLWEAQNKRED